jgi:hypothetical protein
MNAKGEKIELSSEEASTSEEAMIEIERESVFARDRGGPLSELSTSAIRP